MARSYNLIDALLVEHNPDDRFSDANHIFNRDILRSDMLGNWSFEWDSVVTDPYDDPTPTGIVLRFRKLAEHPQKGGIAAVVEERNAHEAALKLDEIRYPFWTATNAADPSLAGVFMADPSLKYTDQEYYYPGQEAPDPFIANNRDPYIEGFSGDIEAFYAHPGYYGYEHNPFTNYRAEWVRDIDHYFRALQLEATSAANIERAVRLITAETYASQLNADLASMDRFIASRERNAVSALYLVEELYKPDQPEDNRTMFQQGLDEDLPVSFVLNPIRVWAATLGHNSKQRRVGHEYGFSTDQYLGLQLGVIKEMGDMYFGLTGGYTRSRNRWNELQSKNTSNNYMLEALLGFRRGMGFLEFSLNTGLMDHKLVRNIELGKDLNDGEYNGKMDCDPYDNYYNGVYRSVQTGNFQNRVFGGGFRLGYQKVLAGKWLFLPTLGLSFQDIRNPSAFTEDGRDISAFRLQFDQGAIQRQTLRAPLMFRLNRGIAATGTGPWIFTPEIRAGVTANFLNRGGSATYKWVGNPIPNRYMKAWGIEEDRFSYQAGASFEVSRRGRFYAAVNYDLNLQSKNIGHSFSLQSGLNF
ncbi:MAG: autotransporter outer membrane beta-barrel domain-containing protein [Planctomycetes bacterium]|nr:autotransporter outer membrane beta-barrel domain-containing protein [Planctomycetota bacterium]